MIAGSLFSGVCGLDLGLTRAGYYHAFFAESDEWRRRVIEAHYPGVDVYSDVRDVAVGGRGVGHVDLLAGGFPCQDLSVAGRRAGLDGARSGLFHEFARIIDALRPRWIMLENVPGLLSSNDGRDMGTVVGTLADLGYGVAWRILDARYFGVPQRRRRVFIVGCAGGDDASALRALCESCDGDPTTSDCTWQRTPSRPGAGAAIAGSLLAKRGKGGGGLSVEEIPNLVVNALDRQRGGPDDNSAQAGHLVTAWAENSRAELVEASVHQSLTKPGGKPGQNMAVARIGSSVRRLTPVECERLMSWPEVLTLYGESDDHIRGSVQSCRTQASAAIRACNGLLGLWEFGRQDGAAPPGHPEPARGSGRAVFSMPREAQPETCPDSGLRRVRFYLPTEAAKACAMLLGPVHRGEQPSFGDPSLGVHASLNGWTAPEGVKAPDSRRYAACGDGVVSNVSEWIGRRIAALHGDAAEAVPLEHDAGADRVVVVGGVAAELVGEVE